MPDTCIALSVMKGYSPALAYFLSFRRQIVDCVEKIKAAIPDENVEVHLSYQSRVGPIEWLVSLSGVFLRKKWKEGEKTTLTA